MRNSQCCKAGRYGMLKVAMVGNPNVGKTALLNALTGGSFEVGNFPGTTVEKKEGRAVINGVEVEFVDLPGIYSLEAYSLDEKIARDYLVNEKPDVVLNVIDATNLERNLYLTLQLCNLGIPMVIALNMLDEARKRGIEIDAKKLEEILGVPVIETIAVEKKGIEELKKALFSPAVCRLRVENRLKLAEQIAKQVVEKKEAFTYLDAIDEVFTDPLFGIPVFFSVMWMVFRFTYDVASPLVNAVDLAFSLLADAIGSEGVLASLLSQGIIKGVGSVLVFVPNIAFLFIALAVMELSGYMARAVFIMDRTMSRFGLNGRAVIPLIMGFGCNVPAIMATRAIEDWKIRITTVLINPFMSCSARLPIYILFAGTFFPSMASAAIMSLYLLGVLLALISAFVLRRFVFRGEAEFIMEMPPYRIPKFSAIAKLTWSRVKHFIEKAGTVILAMSVVIWLLTNYPSNSIEESYAGMLGRAIQPLFAPMDWSWELVVALLMGFVAKEVVVETIGITVGDGLAGLLTPAQAFGFMVFSLLYMPCLATLAVIRTEAGSWKWTGFAVVYSFSVAYVVSLALIKLMRFWRW
ncbi:ferrous iron transport protein B [Archaeoglobus veneficus]|nr:ferrous iron transport protein B [Archaeoglobus veneficus]